jgi:hypothetical protein
MINDGAYSFSPDISVRTQGHKLFNVLSFSEMFLPKNVFKPLEM